MTPLPSGGRLRVATMADAAGIWHVRYAVTENTLTRGRLTDDDLREALEDTGRGWVIERGGVIEAFAIGNRVDGNIWALFVSPQVQGSGHGSRLHDVMVRWLHDQGAPRLWLTTGANTRAAGFYERRGWQRQAVDDRGEARYAWPVAGPAASG